jgi:hypothetical protein
MDMSSPSTDYHAYLLRLWRVQADEGQVWRVSLEPVGRRERHAFPGLEALFAFLQTECATVSTETPVQVSNHISPGGVE